MTYQHQGLAAGRWQKLNFMEQMAHIGSEIERAIVWKKKGNDLYSQEAISRGLELLSLTIDDSRNKKRLKELTRLYEILVDFFFGDNQYGSSNLLWQKYFYAFNYACRVKVE